MYLEHFGLQEAPFQLTPDAAFLFASEQHKRAAAHMEYALANRDGCVVITGEIGCGKTTLLNNFLKQLRGDVTVARIFQTQLDARQFLQTLLRQFGFDAFSKDKAELLYMINRYLLEQHAAGKQVVLVVDEAQNLDFDVLEEVRLLTDIETEKAKTLNVILSGQPELRAKLDDPRLEQLRQRVHFRVHLDPLDMADTGAYVAHRLAVAGYQGEQPLFDEDLVEQVYRFSGGVPRLINTLCDTILMAAYVDDQARPEPATVAAAVEELEWLPYCEVAARNDEAHLAKESSDAPRLILMRDGAVVQRFVIGARRTLIGRDADNDLPVPSEFISRHHLQISYFRGRYWAMDLRSTNGTTFRKQRIQRHCLNHEDVLTFGQHRLVFLHPAQPVGNASDPTTTSLSDWRSTSVLDAEAAVAKGNGNS